MVCRKRFMHTLFYVSENQLGRIKLFFLFCIPKFPKRTRLMCGQHAQQVEHGEAGFYILFFPVHELNRHVYARLQLHQ